MIEIRNIKEPVATLYKETDEGPVCIGEVTSYVQWLDVRVQIFKAQESGYYFMFGDRKIRIDRNGNQDDYPNGWFDEFVMDCLFELV